ncbi:uncharacterized protein LOC141620058 [Silene latifolia]|uniref:uncharacterized protein LOC141620058 n=1 Tax=Silene latifolia TaxID=37657 RepID=UPI003D78A45A
MARPRGRGRGRPAHVPPITEAPSTDCEANSGEIPRSPIVFNSLINDVGSSHSRPNTFKAALSSFKASGDTLFDDIEPSLEVPNPEFPLLENPTVEKSQPPTTDSNGSDIPKSWTTVAKAKAGMSLHFCEQSAASTEIDICEDDIEGELQYWKYTLMGNVLGAKPTTTQMHTFVAKHWNHVSLPTVQYFRRGWFSFRFPSQTDMDEVLKGGPWSMGNNSMVLKQWSPTFTKEMDKISVVPIWILFPDLDPLLWSDIVLSKLANKVGKPMYADMTTTTKARLSFARVLVEADLSTELPENVILNTPFHGQINQQIVYEWRPYYCVCCGKMGHTDNFCKLNKAKQAAKEVWRP